MERWEELAEEAIQEMRSHPCGYRKGEVLAKRLAKAEAEIERLRAALEARGAPELAHIPPHLRKDWLYERDGKKKGGA